MIHEVSGDILLTKAQAIAHGVAPNDHFDHGLAAALHERWPTMVKDFRHYAHQTHPKPGEFWFWDATGVQVFNLLTQEGEHGHGAKPGRATTAYVNHSLKRLRHELEKEKIKSVALPKLATGVGGLDWTVVLPLIHTHLGDLSISVFVYTHCQKGVQATEVGA
ncbi:Macro domain protein [Anatilimnocola aggregata]|uniref:Macro domain protein n=1 Tax=Anatilimnocola aggregata TaxID=2528021 RepID=A0A517YFB6_9BACT|nr:macro domain-containing protein [Anatilimnocola aggregata]QDU28924.1 Macro domain protein [Anatilimnocola aggregata]